MADTFALKRRYAQADYAGQPGPNGGYVLVLDGKPVQTPEMRSVCAPTEKLAAALASEWQAQGENIVPATMPLNQLLITALDRVAEQRAAIVQELLRFLDTELICHYGAGEELVAYQRQHWQPLHNWLAERFQVILPVTFGIQPMRAVLPLDIFEQHLACYDDYRLAALSQAVAVSGSFVIGLALVEQAVAADVALLAAEAESDYQQRQWGFDAEAAARRDGVARDLAAVDEFVRLLA